MAEGTINIRVAVAIGPGGDWCAQAWGGKFVEKQEDRRNMEYAVDGVEGLPVDRFFIEVERQIKRIETVTGTVTEEV